MSAALCNAGYGCGLDDLLGLFLLTDCMQEKYNLQTGQAVKEFAWQRVPFANGDLLSVNEFKRVWERYVERAFNWLNRVLHDFSLAIPEVRNVGTSKRKTVIQCV